VFFARFDLTRAYFAIFGIFSIKTRGNVVRHFRTRASGAIFGQNRAIFRLTDISKIDKIIAIYGLIFSKEVIKWTQNRVLSSQMDLS
jgi:hypothetical protein